MAAYAITGVITVILDQLSKFFLSHLLFPGQSIPIIKNIFHITLVHNTGCAFGIFKNQGLFFIIISIMVIFYIIWYWIKKPAKVKEERLLKIGLILILSGAGGNLIDRLCFGYVIDFLDFRIWPVFNLADTAITIGSILIVWLALVQKKK